MLRIENILYLIIILLLISSCESLKNSSKEDTIVIVRDTVYLENSGSLVAVPEKIKDEIAVKGLTYPVRYLENDFDSFTIKNGEPFIIECKVDTTKSTIVTKVETEKGEITFSVEPKFKPYEVLLNSICDAIYIPTTDLLIRIDDNYNKTNKPYKIVTVPICDNSKNITGYLVRYDTEGRVGKKCDNNKYVNDMEKMFKECQGENDIQKPTCPCRVKSDCNAPEWKYFRICVSVRK